MKPALAAVLFALTGCAPTTALINGQEVPRPTLGYTDHYYYAVTHYSAYPEQRGPSSGLRSYAGRIAGYACGAEISYEADYRGRSLQLLGYVEPTFQSAGTPATTQPAHMEVRDEPMVRHFRGSVGDDIGGLFIAHDRPSAVIDFTLGRDSLHGQIGSRRFALEAVDDDTLSGTVVIANAAPRPFLVRGISAVWAMPPADQAAILPFMLTCSEVEAGRADVGVYVDSTIPLLTVDFRGRI
jgi:hypothetical protein